VGDDSAMLKGGQRRQDLGFLEDDPDVLAEYRRATSFVHR